MFTSSIPHGSTSHPLSHSQTGNPSSSPTSNYYPSGSTNDQIYQFDIADDVLDYYFLSMADPPYYQDSRYSSFTSCFNNEQTPVLQETTTPAAGMKSLVGSINTTSMPPPSNIDMQVDEFNREGVHSGSRIALRMKTNLEIVDDGYKWRKYGKKMVKSSPNPRHYYKCWVVGCNIKKQVERDRDDSSYVITTYQGVHNHGDCSTIHYNTPSGTEFSINLKSKRQP